MVPKIDSTEKKIILAEAIKANKDVLSVTRSKLNNNLIKKTEKERDLTKEFMKKHCWQMDGEGIYKRPDFQKAPDF